VIQTRLSTFGMCMNLQIFKRYYQCDLTDEMEFGCGCYIEEFVSGGPKNCIFCILPLYRKMYN